MSDLAKIVKPTAYRYRYTDPISGHPVWRDTSERWNGQLPSGSMPLYSADALHALIEEAVKAGLEMGARNGAFHAPERIAEAVTKVLGEEKP